MELWRILIPWLAILHGTSATDKFSPENFFRLLSETKAELAKSFFKRDLKEKENEKIVNLTHSNVEELKFVNAGRNGRMFRSADENFMYNGVEVLHLERGETPTGRYTLNAVDDVRLAEGAVFFKNAEWKNKIFLAICYQRGYCEIRMSAPSLKSNLKSKIDTGMLPLDVSFFGTDDDLFLIVVQDPVTIYRWTGTYFNEDAHLDTTGAQSVAAFQDKDKSIITVAQNLGSSKVYSKVYIRKNENVELFQLLPTSQALRVLPFELTHGSNVLNFVFVLNGAPPSAIFWWTGKEFVPWKSLENLFGSRIVYVGKIKSELFFFISDKNKIYVYHPTVMSFDLMQIITFDQEVVGIDLRIEKDEMPLLVLLTGSALDPYFKVNLILLQINYVSDLEEENKSSGGILQCLSSLEKKLDGRKTKLEEIYRKLGRSRRPGVENLELESLEESLQDTAGKVLALRERFRAIKNESMPNEGRRYHVREDLKIGRMNAKRIDAEVLNGKLVDLGGLLSLTKDQTLGGVVELKTLSTDVLMTPSVNGVEVEDILLRNKGIQKVTGDFSLASLTAKEIKFGSSSSLNGIPSSDLLTRETPENEIIKGRKVLEKVKAKQVKVEMINNVPSEKWLSEILPSLKTENEEEPLNFTELTVEKLWVSNLNGIPWDDFVDSVYLPLNNEVIKGEMRATGKVRIERIKAKKINGVPMEEILTKSVRGNVTCGKKQKKKPKSLPLELSPVWDDSFLKNLLNEPGYEFEDDVKYFTGTQVMDGDVRAGHVFFKNSLLQSDLVVEDLENLKTRFWMKNQAQVVTSPVEFTNGISVTNSLVANQINNNLSLNSFIWTDRANLVPANLQFENAHITGDVTFAEGVIQNVDLKHLNGTSVKTAGENVISGRKRFSGSLTTSQLNADVLNGADVANLLSSMKGSDEIEASDLMIFGNLEVKNGVRVRRINDADFNETISKALTWNDPELFRKAQFRSLSVKNLDVDTINGLNVEDKLPKLSKTQKKDVYVVVEGNFEVPELNATKVNGINFNKYINQVYQANEKETIRGEKIFKGMVTVTGNLKGNLNEYNITELESVALSKSKPQTVTGVYTVEEFQTNELEAENVDGVSTEEVLYQDTADEQVVNSDVILGNVAIAADIKTVNFMNDCDLRKVTGVNLENVADFESLEVEGDLSWESSRERFQGLSEFLRNAVTKSGDQVITGTVVFENEVVMKDVNGKRHFNEVDLGFIAEDAIYQSLGEQEISTPVTFKGDVKANRMDILGNVLIDSINGVDITDLEDRLVRKSADVIVRGKKTFRKGFSADYFNAETVNGAKINQIVFYDDVEDGKEIRFPPTTFTKLNVFKDLKVFRINGHPFEEFLEGRLSKTGEQVMNGKIVVEGNVTIKGDGNIQRINDVIVEEGILADGEVSAKVITGDIEFRDRMSIADKLEVDYINGQNMTALLEKALMVDEDAVIEGDVEFDSDITVEGDIDVRNTVNSCDLKKVTQMDFTDGSDETNYKTRKSLREEVEKLSNLTATMRKPVVFMYLKEALQLDLHLPTIHGSVANKYNDSVRFNIYGMNFGDCGLPVECYCPTQTNLKINSLKPPSVELEANSSRYFTYHDEGLGVEVNVSTTTVSYSSRCKRRDDQIQNEFTSISWRTVADGELRTYERKIFQGFLSDVKFFRLGDSVYVVAAFYFHPSINGTNNLQTVVYELKVDEGKMEKIDEILSTGAQVLEVFWTTKGVILVIGNSFDSDRFTDSVNSAIYRFNEYENKFELLRYVKTHGILSVQSMRYKKSSFIFFVQKQTWPLLILKYNQDYDNYYFSQKLDTTQSLVRSNFLSVSVISTSTPGYSGDLFVGIVLSDDSFRLFKYKHIEGFVEESYQEQNNVKILHPFWLGSTQYLLAGSGSDVSKIYSFVEQGR